MRTYKFLLKNIRLKALILASLSLNKWFKYYMLIDNISVRRFSLPISVAILCMVLVLSDMVSYLNSGWYDLIQSAQLPFYIIMANIYVQSGMLNKENVVASIKAMLFAFFSLVLVYLLFDINLFKYTRLIEKYYSGDADLDFDNENRWAIGNPNSFGITILSLTMILRVASGGVSWVYLLMSVIVVFFGKGRSCLACGILYLFLCQIVDQNSVRRVFFLINVAIGGLIVFDLFEDSFSRLVFFGHEGDQRRYVILEIIKKEWKEILFIGKGAGRLQVEVLGQTSRYSSGESFFLEAVYAYGFLVSGFMIMAFIYRSRIWWREIICLTVLGLTNSINGYIIVVILCVLMHISKSKVLN